MKTFSISASLSALLIAAGLMIQPVPVFADDKEAIQGSTSEKGQPGSQEARKRARAYLDRFSNVRALDRAGLRQAIARGQELVGLPTGRNFRNAIRKTVRRAQREQQRRAQAQQNNNQQQQQNQQQQNNQQSPVNQQARSFLRSTQNLAGMNRRQLRNTVNQGRALAGQQGLRNRLKRQVNNRVAQANRELQRRANANQQQQNNNQQGQQQQQNNNQGSNANRRAQRYLDNAPNVRNLGREQLQNRVRRGRAILNMDGLRNRLARQVRQEVRAARTELDRRNAAQQQQNQQNNQARSADRQARQFIRERVNVRNISDRRLDRHIQQGRNILGLEGLSRRLERQVREKVRVARDERRRRNNAAQQPEPNDDQNRAARRLLEDNRPASALNDRQLRRRLERARAIMASRDLNRRLFRRVREMSRRDRDELRARIARRDENLQENRQDRQDARQLIRDRRDVRDLNDRQLQARIRSARDLLQGDNLRASQRDALQRILREARREKRRRLVADRSRRRERLRNNRNNNQIVIQIPSIRIGPDRADIAAAEADDRLLQEQLVAPPRRRIERKFSRNDFRSGRSSARQYMPAIEVDTIRFGFNEAFVREEEIPQLERIGEIIERIVAGNPDEVFLIEGHTDAVGSDAYNQRLSQQRANAVRDAMLQFFNIERANIETVGYGEEFLKIETPDAEQENRRVTIRRITPLLARN